MRKMSILLSVVMIISILSACADKTAQPETLVIYTSMKDSLITELTADFTKNTNIAVETRIDGAGSLMSQIESERDAGQILADVIWTSELPDFYYMKDQNLLLQYRPVGADDLLNPLEDTDDFFLPARLGTMGIAYNTDIIKTPPQSWQSLLETDFAGRFAFANPETSGTALMGVFLLNQAFGQDYFRGLRANGAYIGQGSTWVVDAVASGEIAAGLAVDYITFDKAKSGAPIAMFYPQEMLVIPSPAAIFKDSLNTAAAQKFVDYLITPEAQRLINNSGTLPVLSGIPASGEYNIPPVTDAMARAINLNQSDLIAQKDDVVSAFMEIMR
ncbi:MAG: ABC transporter substrate-binding protein [Oscillospiraceae bacterium]|nr:ABC transporter substrate-binding protein [Oscillospiraceae bacterium]